tara:strand:- start:2335 stop:2853 length:519 start_codon:yes stop_codon:yes gene_type:complete
MASVFRTLVQKLGSSSAAQFIGRKGDLFFDPDQATPILKVSDGTTAGGVSVTGGGIRYKGTAEFTNFGSSPAGAWGSGPGGAGITATFGAISSPNGYSTFQFTFTMAHDYGDTDSYLILAQGHYHPDSSTGRGAPLVVNMEKINGTTFIGTVSDPTSAVADDGKFDLFVFDA